MAGAPDNVAQSFVDWREGDLSALDRLMPLMYDELRRLAGRYMRGERSNHTLQPTDLVHEAYLRLVGANVRSGDRVHFLALAAHVMRHILVDHARKYQYAKRGAGARRVTLDEAIDVSEDGAVNLVLLDEAMTTLAGIDTRKSQVVELQYFGGLTQEETAKFLGVSLTTIQRETKMARAWLHRELGLRGQGG
ncbi:MAG: sigma-70 family RNA polymerase sigma factor [Acidobacteria bacterium]|nr:sigma-70 family RNA polymerase sigma factor [Acidobacteriota bacterium]